MSTHFGFLGVCLLAACTLHSQSDAQAPPLPSGATTTARQEVAAARTIVNKIRASTDQAVTSLSGTQKKAAEAMQLEINADLADVVAWWRPQCPTSEASLSSADSQDDCAKAMVLRYSKSLTTMALFLDTALAKKDAGATLEALKDVTEDLTLKADHCRHTWGGIGDTARLTIHTKKNNDEVSGWQIFYRLKCDPNAAGDLFPKMSSPTSLDLPPGKYLIWAKSGDKISTVMMVKVGQDANGDWDLPI